MDKNLKKKVLMKAVQKAGKVPSKAVSAPDMLPKVPDMKSKVGKVADMNMPGTPGSEMIGGMGMSKYKNLSSKLNK